jgi:hypothetical protein
MLTPKRGHEIHEEWENKQTTCTQKSYRESGVQSTAISLLNDRIHVGPWAPRSGHWAKSSSL